MIEIFKTDLCKFNKIQGIYAIVNTLCPSKYCSFGKMYIGQASNGKKNGVGRRLHSHLLSLNKEICPKWASQHLWRAYKKYGENSFKLFFIEEVIDSINLTTREDYWINIFQSNDENFGYNKRKAADSNKGSIFKPISTNQIIEMINEYKCQTGDYPTQRSNLVWKSIDEALRTGLRGLPIIGGLSKFISIEFKIITRATKPPLTQENVKLMAINHYEKTNKWPNQYSGKILLASKLNYEPSLTWAAIYQAIHGKLRGWPIEKDDLALFLAREFDIINHTNRPEITHTLISNLIINYKTKFNKYPNCKSGWIDELGMTWQTLEKVIQKNLNSSVAQIKKYLNSSKNNSLIPA